MMKPIFTKAAALLVVLLMLAGIGCAKNPDSEKTIAGYTLEANDAGSTVTYPYVIHTPHATWYLAAADIELLGEEAFFAGLETMLANQEADFSDACAVFDGFLSGDVPPVEIHTDFAGRSERAKRDYVGAYYLGPEFGIYLYRDWGTAGYALLHEYTHYLSFECCTFELRDGFWAEGLAEYVSMLTCQNRMGRAVRFGLPEEMIAEGETRGYIDAEGTVDAANLYHGLAAIYRTGAWIGTQYTAVSQSPITMTERMLEHPMMTTLTYYEAGCFFEWLIDRFGKELVFAHMTVGQEAFPDVFGADFETLFFRWAADNRTWCEQNGLDLTLKEE